MHTTFHLCLWLFFLVTALPRASGFERGPHGEVFSISTDLTEPEGITEGASGTVYIADTQNHRLMYLDPSSPTTLQVLAGTGFAGLTDGPAASAQFQRPKGLAVDEAAGKLYIADTGNHCIRVLDLSTAGNPVSTLAGNGNDGFQDGLITSSLFYSPRGLALSSGLGGLLVADQFNHRVRFIPVVAGAGQSSVSVTTVAGTGQPGFVDGATGVSELRFPTDVVMGPVGSALADVVYVSHAHTIRSITKINANNFQTDTLIGSATPGFADGNNTEVVMYDPMGLNTDERGHLYFVDKTNHRIRVFDLFNPTRPVRTMGGSDTRGMRDGAPAQSLFDSPAGTASFGPPTLDNYLYVLDTANSRLRAFSAVCFDACQHGGNCTHHKTCTCAAGWMGDVCEQAICTTPCTNGEVCVTPDFCRCADGYNGVNCADAICAQTCLNGAPCSAPNTCACLAGWTGQACEIAICDQPCEHGSNCTAPNSCNCFPGYSGNYCENIICTDPCVNGGNCTLPDTCTCPSTWMGPTCAEPVCTTLCQNGICTAPDTCTCEFGWSGVGCEIPICNAPCVNGGVCIGPDTCNCTTGWSGIDCSTPVCTQVCANGGACTLPDICTCATGWTGANCTEAICLSPACGPGQRCALPETCVSTCTVVDCQNGGSCVGDNECACVGGWLGIECTLATCADGCDIGVCVAPDVCSCAPGYMGVACDIPICTEPCQNGGECTAPDTCTCTSEWVGELCEIPICPQGNATLPMTCLNGGICGAPNLCNCTSSWSGVLCELPVCASCVFGICTAPDTCICNDGYKGLDCGEEIIIVQTTFDKHGPAIYSGIAIGSFIFVCTIAWNVRMCLDRQRMKRYRFAQQMEMEGYMHPQTEFSVSEGSGNSVQSRIDAFRLHGAGDMLSEAGLHSVRSEHESGSESGSVSRSRSYSSSSGVSSSSSGSLSRSGSRSYSHSQSGARGSGSRDSRGSRSASSRGASASFSGSQRPDRLRLSSRPLSSASRSPIPGQIDDGEDGPDQYSSQEDSTDSEIRQAEFIPAPPVRQPSQLPPMKHRPLPLGALGDSDSYHSVSEEGEGDP